MMPIEKDNIMSLCLHIVSVEAYRIIQTTYNLGWVVIYWILWDAGRVWLCDAEVPWKR